jgi:photosystem II stability/assembly factor-like uncharacterized protein
MRHVLLAAALAITSTANAQFDLQDSHSTASFRGIHSLGNGTAWASGTEGTVLHTADGGKNWQRCTTPPDAEKLDFRGIQAFDQNTAIVMSSGKGDLSRLYKTTDACKTWKLVFTNPDKDGFWDAIQFINAKRFPKEKDFGMLVGDPVDGRFVIFLTFDSGEHWERQLKEAPPSQAGEGLYAASNSSLSVTSFRERSFVTGGPEGSRLITFTMYPGDTTQKGDLDANVAPGSKPFYFNAKRRWGAVALPLAAGASAGGFSIASRPIAPSDLAGQVRVMVGGDYKNPDSHQGTASFNSPSLSSGFKPSQTPPHGYRSAVAYDAKTKTWITVGPNGTDISHDDGRNWTALKPTAQDAPDADKNWNALSLPFVVGPKGRIGRLRPDALKD